jgi:hypothetical protein
MLRYNCRTVERWGEAMEERRGAGGPRDKDARDEDASDEDASDEDAGTGVDCRCLLRGILSASDVKK